MSLFDSTKAIAFFLLPEAQLLMTDCNFWLFALDMMEKSDVYDTDFLLRMLSIMETDLLDRRNSSSGSY